MSHLRDFVVDHQTRTRIDPVFPRGPAEFERHDFAARLD